VEIRIDRLKLLCDIAELPPDQLNQAVSFEAIIRFDDGTVNCSSPHPTREAALLAARWLLREWKHKDTLPPAYQQTAIEADELWAIGEEVESSEWLYQLIGVIQYGKTC